MAQNEIIMNELTEQEIQFAEEFVFLYFNDNEKASDILGMRAAVVAGYDIPEDRLEANEFIKTLLGETEGASTDIKSYIETLIEDFRKKFAIENKRSLWELISAWKLAV